MTYAEKLKKKKWKAKRLEILERDNFTCSKCGNVDFSKTFLSTYDEKGNLERYCYHNESNTLEQFFEKSGITISHKFEYNEYPKIPIMNVHHKKYILNTNPWDYDNDDLITLCSDCHKKLHKKEKIPIFNKQGQLVDKAGKCPRCKGSGYIPIYRHVQGGICFRCWGEGIDLWAIDKYKKIV